MYTSRYAHPSSILGWKPIPVCACPIRPAQLTRVAVTQEEGVGGQRAAILAFVADSIYADRLCVHAVRSHSARSAYIGIYAFLDPPPSGMRMFEQVCTAQFTHAEKCVPGKSPQCSDNDTYVHARGYRHVFVAGIVSIACAYGPWASAFYPSTFHNGEPEKSTRLKFSV